MSAAHEPVPGMSDSVDEPTSVGVVLGEYARNRERVAITHARGEWTYGDLLDEVYRVARALHAFGLGRGDVVAVLTGNRPETVVLRHAANVLGCAVAMLYDGLAPPRMAELLRTTDAAAVVCDPTRIEAASAALTDANGVALLTLGACEVGTDLAERAATESAESIEIQARAEDLAAIRLTGGSTGTPKGVPRRFRVPPYLSANALANRRDEVQLLCTPIAHLGGTLADIVLAAGGRVVLHERFEPGAVFAAIAEQRVTFLWLQPHLLHRLLDYPGSETADTSSLVSLTCGGAPAAAHRMAEAVRRFGPIVAQGYGTLEATQISWLHEEEHLRPELLTTVGRPVGAAEVSIRDPDGKPVTTGESGEIWVRGPAVMTGYYRAPEQTAAVLRDGWFMTGDLGHLDEAGYLTVAGRIKDVIIAKGERVYPADVEGVLLQHPDVASASVFGMVDVDGAETVCAAVVATPGAQVRQSDLVRWVTERRGELFAPSVVLALDELPVTGSGKADREVLRRLVDHR